VAKKHAEGRHIRVYDVLFDSLAFRTLPGSALKLWLDLRTQYFGSNNGRIPCTLNTLERRGWNSNQKLRRALQQLLDRGLLKCTRQSGPNKFHRASLYAFTDLDIARNDAEGIAGSQPTHEYMSWIAPISEKCVVPKRAPNGTRNGTATVPETGQRAVGTVPETGQRARKPKPAPAVALRAIGD
jgi:hypothetical protein